MKLWQKAGKMYEKNNMQKLNVWLLSKTGTTYIS